MDKGQGTFVPGGGARLYPEGMIGLSPTTQSLRRGQVCGSIRLITRARQSVATAAWGFNPRNTPTSRRALKGRKMFLVEGVFRKPRFYRHLRGGRSFYQYLGLKPQAESYYPFGTSPTVPIETINSLLSTKSTPLSYACFEDEDDFGVVTECG